MRRTEKYEFIWDKKELTKQSANQGLEYIKTHKGTAVFGLERGYFNYLFADNRKAKKLKGAVHKGLYHSNGSMVDALGETISRAVKELGATATYEDEKGNPCGEKFEYKSSYDLDFPERAAHLVVRF